jgi:hypothetical protein
VMGAEELSYLRLPTAIGPLRVDRDGARAAAEKPDAVCIATAPVRAVMAAIPEHSGAGGCRVCGCMMAALRRDECVTGQRA